MLELGILLILLILGYSVGSYREKRHYQSIFEREKALADILVFESRVVPEGVIGGQMLQGNVVISTDYFKRFVAGLRMLVGGRLGTYESLLDRGRREAVLRMKEQAREQGIQQIFNVRFETSSISKGAESTIGSIEVLVYGSGVNPSTP